MSIDQAQGPAVLGFLRFSHLCIVSFGLGRHVGQHRPPAATGTGDGCGPRPPAPCLPLPHRCWHSFLPIVKRNDSVVLLMANNSLDYKFLCVIQLD